MIRRLGERWTIPILVALRGGGLRFAGVKKSLGGVSHRMLVRSLKNLERDGLVSRFEITGTPPQVSYSLTRLGEALLEEVDALLRWQRDNDPADCAARRLYDGRPSA